MSNATRARAWGLLALALLGSAAVQWPALHSDFRHDDWLTFYQAANLRPLDFILTLHGGHLMMTRNAIHLAFFELFDLNPVPYFVAAFATHLLNVALLFLFALRLVRSAAIAALVAALWGMAPVQQASVNWVALYGNMTVATFLLWPLADLAHLAAEQRAPSRWMLVRWAVLLAAAATSFGPGLAAALMFWITAWLFLPRESRRNQVAVAMAFVALALATGYLALRPALPAGSGEFWLSLGGVLAEARALSGLLSYGIASLVGGGWLTYADEGVPFGPLQGPSATPLLHATWVVAAFVCAVLAWAWQRATELERRQMLGLLLPILAIQGLVALARARLAIYLVGLDVLTVTARYQYVATVFWSGCFALALAQIVRELRRARPTWHAPAWLAPAALAVWTAAVVVPHARAARRVDWNSTAGNREAFESERAWLQEQIDKAAPGAEVVIENHPFAGMDMIRVLVTEDQFPGVAAVFLLLQHNAPHKSSHVKFIESDRAVVEQLRARPHTKIADLLLTPEEAAAVSRTVSAPAR